MMPINLVSTNIQLGRFVKDALGMILSGSGYGTTLTQAQQLSILIGLSGLNTTDESVVGRTFTFIYRDKATGKYNFQTAAIPQHHALSPFRVEFGEGKATIFYTGTHVPGVEVFPLEVGLHASIREASSHYFSRVDPELRELPVAIIVNPYPTCAGGCPSCARGAIGSFSRPPRDYVDQHLRQLAEDYDRRGWNRTHLGSVNITTGCQPTAETELRMMLELMEAYRTYGFTEARFNVFSYNISDADHMRQLLDAGAVGYIGTIETMNDQARIAHWGRTKGSITFQEHMERYMRAMAVGFEIVETDYVIGTDRYDDMMEGLIELDRHGVAVVGNMLRSYNMQQLGMVDGDLWSRGFQYVLDGFEGCLRSYRHNTIKRRAAILAVEWMARMQGRILSVEQLPIRHT